MKRGIELLITAIEERLTWARKAEGDCATLVMHSGAVQRDEPDEDWDDASLRLGFYTERLRVEVGMLAELLQVPATLKRFQKEFRRYKRVSEVSYEPDSDYPVSAALAHVNSFYNSLLPVAGMGHGPRLDAFRSILGSTAKIIADGNLDPANEAQVRNAVLRVVNYAFPDSVREVTLNQLIKNYQGDIGVVSLGAVAEYKFIDSKAELNTCLDGIYSDMKSYRVGDDWQHYYAVLYMTDAFCTQEEVDLAFASVRAESNWQAIVITGRGGRPPPSGESCGQESKSQKRLLIPTERRFNAFSKAPARA